MKIAIVICLTVIIVALLITLPTLQKQRYEHLEEVQKRDYELARKQLEADAEVEKERVRYNR